MLSRSTILIVSVLFAVILCICQAFFVPVRSTTSRSCNAYPVKGGRIASFHLYSTTKPEEPETTSSSTEASGAAKEDASASAPLSSTTSSSGGPCSKFPKCDGAMRNRGCDGSGKIQGGIATVPGLGWWPIKAYRPCPAVVEAGYGYRREGQTFGEFIEGKRKKRED